MKKKKNTATIWQQNGKAVLSKKTILNGGFTGMYWVWAVQHPAASNIKVCVHLLWNKVSEDNTEETF